jgi:hypothetical protein
MRTFLRGKITLLFLAFAVLLAVPAVALADILNVNDLVTGGDVSVTKPATAATNGTAQIYLVATSGDTATFDDPSNDPLNNCNANNANAVTVTFTQSAVNASGQTITSPVTLGANSVSLTGCDDPALAGIQNSKPLTYTVGMSANIGDKITVKGTASGGRTTGSLPGGGTFTTDQFVITIVAPPEKGTTLTVDPASGTYGGSADLTATLACPTCAAGTDLGGKTIDFTLNGTPVGSATTNSSGVATKRA